MPAALMPKDEILSRLMALFREHGYDGTSMSDISAATGLGKSSIYHHFPGGKQQMAAAALEHLAATLDPVLESLGDRRPPRAKLDALLGALDDFYQGGRAACLLERLTASVDRTRLARPLAASFRSLLGAFEKLSQEAGVDRAEARRRAEDAVVRIEGSLIVAAGTGDPQVFRRAMETIRATLLAAPAGRPTRFVTAPRRS
jgi:TetR/AcrR family transcriptional regulator, lmrAB and yxaGH operons repressor